MKKTAENDAPGFIDLFCGGGGLSTGFVRAGLRPLLALDSDASALKTYAVNHPSVPDERLLCTDVRTLQPGELKKRLGRERVAVVLAAPPCQGFSSVGGKSKRSSKSGRWRGYQTDADQRNHLFEYFIAVTRELHPQLVLMENVPGMSAAWSTSRGNLCFLEAASRDLEALGYKASTWKLQASAYGVPQDRSRHFLVASRLRSLPPLPEPEYQTTSPSAFDSDGLPPVKFDEATFDLPAVEAGSGRAVELWSEEQKAGDSRLRRYLDKFRLRAASQVLYNHTARSNNERDLELYALLKPGEDSVHAIERYHRADLMRYRRDVFDDKYARLRGDRPAKTIVSHLAKDGNGYIHPTQVRSITIREAARLQSFGDDYLFCGSPSDQWIQVGNAVPPILGEAIARSFLVTLAREKRE